MKKTALFLLIFSVLTLLTCIAVTFLPLSGEEELYDKVIRLHVLANSDSEEDQALKLSVRDAVLTSLEDEFDDSITREEAAEKLRAQLGDVTTAAQDEINAQGYDYDVSVSLNEEYYPTKEYENITMPAGTYLSLKVEIGEAAGHNWWCVVYPPLCLSAAMKSEDDNEDALLRAGFTGEQYKIITQTDEPKYKLKFKILELFESWFK